MSSSTSVANDATISSLLRSPSVSAKFAFKSTATSSLATLGSSLSASTTLSILYYYPIDARDLYIYIWFLDIYSASTSIGDGFVKL